MIRLLLSMRWMFLQHVSMSSEYLSATEKVMGPTGCTFSTLQDPHNTFFNGKYEHISSFLFIPFNYGYQIWHRTISEISTSLTATLLNCAFSVFTRRESQIWGKEMFPLNSLPIYVFIATTWDGTFNHWKGHYINRSYCVTASYQ